MTSRSRYMLIGGLLILASLAIADGFWIKGKAMVSQYLLEDAWQQVQKGRQHVSPWSWADTWPVARLSAPRMDVDQIVLSGASGRVLAFGPGHVAGTALPGVMGNTVLSGHRDTHFNWLKDVQVGDRIQMEVTDGRLLQYAVETRSVHHESETELLEQGQGNILRLITCYPFNAVVPGGDQRFVVTARAVAF